MVNMENRFKQNLYGQDHFSFNNENKRSTTSNDFELNKYYLGHDPEQHSGNLAVDWIPCMLM